MPPARIELATEINVHHVTKFHADVNFGSIGHTKKSFYKNDKETMKAIEDFMLPPSIIIHSGGGFQCYWLLKQLIKVKDTGLDYLKSINKRIVDLLHGYNIQNLNFVLRVPGSYNFKIPDNPRYVYLLLESHEKYTLEEMAQVLEWEPEVVKIQDKSSSTEDEFNRRVSMCEFIKWCEENPDEVSEPLWFAMISNVARMEPGGRERAVSGLFQL